jgi:site-specific recombinase XerD
MNTQAIQTRRECDPAAVLIPQGADKHARYRLGKFVGWLTEEKRAWSDPDLAAYRDDLLADGYAPSTVSDHLSTVRGQYERLLSDNQVRDELEITVRSGLEAQGDAYGPADVEALVNRTERRIENATNPRNSPVRVKVSQDRADAAHLRLTAAQASALMAAPGVGNLKGLRDTAVISLMLCTGIREAELSALEVRDLRQALGGELALHVREGKGRKERLIPYGDLDWVLAVVEAWLAATGIEEDPVFRGFWRGNETLRPGPLSVRAVQYILASYPVMVDGELTHVKPHDLRRTYARRLYEAGVDLVAIQQNLGHANVKTTLRYIGTLDAEARRAPAVYTFDLSRLYQQEKMDV